MKTLLISTFEMGHQPLLLASAAAALRAQDFEVDVLDAAVQTPEASRIREANLVAISVPMHTAAKLGIALARGVRRLNPTTHIAFFGLYASPLADQLVSAGVADSVVGGEYETGLVSLAQSLAEDGFHASSSPVGVGPHPLLNRQLHPLPDRSGLPALENYSHVDIGGELKLAGYVEASRGCAHSCTHCPLTPVYGGRLRVVAADTVLADIDQLVQLGAAHITFGDPDFFNAVPLSLSIVERLHDLHPQISFDATIKVQHLLEHADSLPRLSDLGCLFITSAFESTDDDVLSRLEKGHSRADLDTALLATKAAGIALRPTWMAFTPWTTAHSLLEMLDFVESNGLVRNVQPIQYGLKLLLPPGSSLIETIDGQGRLEAYDQEALSFDWSNPDSRLEPLRRELARIAERDAAAGPDGRPIDYLETFAKVKRAAYAALVEQDEPPAPAPQPALHVPGLTEAWFC